MADAGDLMLTTWCHGRGARLQVGGVASGAAGKAGTAAAACGAGMGVASRQVVVGEAPAAQEVLYLDAALFSELGESVVFSLP